MSWERPRTGGSGLGQDGILISLSALIFGDSVVAVYFCRLLS